MRFFSEFELMQHIHQLGGTLYRVGGQVRDTMLNRDIKDRDYVVTGLNPSDMVGFDKVVGSSFPVFIVDCGKFGQVEVALARTEKKVSVGHNGFTFHSGSSVTIEEDLKRRDLTINAIAQRVDSQELIDPFGGQVHIQMKRLVVVDEETFVEDPLRAYRVARFAATLDGFDVDEETRNLISTMRASLQELSPERVYGELKKAMMGSHPSHFFQTLRWSGLLSVHFPEVWALDVPDMHDGTALRHTLRLLDRSPADFKVRMGLLAHDLGKGRTPPGDHPHHYGHDQLGQYPVNELCLRLRIPSDVSRIMIKSATEHMKIKVIPEMRPGNLIRWVWDHHRDVVYLVLVSEIDSKKRLLANHKEQEELFKNIRARLLKAHMAIGSVNGQDLIGDGILPDRNFGEKLHQRRVEKFREIERESR